MDRPLCETCPHWLDMRSPCDPDDIGICMLSPPIPVYAIQDRSGKLLMHWVQPDTEAFDSCSQHPNFPAYIASRTGN